MYAENNNDMQYTGSELNFYMNELNDARKDKEENVKWIARKTEHRKVVRTK